MGWVKNNPFAVGFRGKFRPIFGVVKRLMLVFGEGEIQKGFSVHGISWHECQHDFIRSKKKTLRPSRKPNMKPEVLPPCKTSIYHFGGSMSILESVPNVATKLNDSLIVFFLGRVTVARCATRSIIQKLKKTSRRSSQTMRNTAMFFIYQS